MKKKRKRQHLKKKTTFKYDNQQSIDPDKE